MEDGSELLLYVRPRVRLECYLHYFAVLRAWLLNQYIGTAASLDRGSGYMCDFYSHNTARIAACAACSLIR